MPTVDWLVLVLTEASRGNGMAQFATERVAGSKPLGLSSPILCRLRPDSLLLVEPVLLGELVPVSDCIAENLVDLKDGNGRSSFFIGVSPVFALICMEYNANKATS